MIKADLQVHLDAIGGLSGDMFVAALVDAWPELAEDIPAVVRHAGLHSSTTAVLAPHRDHALTGMQFKVTHESAESEDDHARFADIRRHLMTSSLAAGTIERAVAIFSELAEAEGRVHGVRPDDVTFHEVGAWDSIADIVVAAHLIESLQADRWSVSALPLGSGRVDSSHGLLPVPAPAVTELLQGFVVWDDGIEDERITPTGAAILRHLAPSYGPSRRPVMLMRSGTGFGSRQLPGISNVLRVIAFEGLTHAAHSDDVVVVEFEVDDQTAEDLAVGIEHIRKREAVIDVLQVPVLGKKGRLATQVQILARPEALETVVESCFLETTTLGLRWHEAHRAVLERNAVACTVRGRPVRVKTSQRPTGIVTAKAEIGDVADTAGGFPKRPRTRLRAEAAVLGEDDPDG